MKFTTNTNAKNAMLHRLLTMNRKSQGFTLVELMVAVTISLIILVAVAQLFATSRSTYGLEENLARVQENGRFAMEFLTQDIRMAGYAGCNSTLTQGTPVGGTCPIGTVCNLVNMNSVTADTAITFNPDGIKGHKYTGTGTALTDWSPALPADYFSNGEVVAGTDVIIIQRASTFDTHLTGNPTPDNANIQVLATSSLASQLNGGDILMVSDCKSADVFKATGASSGSGKITITHSTDIITTPPNLTHSYGNDAQLMSVIARAYYIGRRNNSASNPPALFRKELVNSSGTPQLQTQELVEGVENMRFLYGEDTDTSPSDNVTNIYRAPSSVANWRRVINVRVGLLVRTLNNVQDTDTKTYTVAGAALGPYNDNLRRRVFSSTVRVRNR